MEIYSRRTAPKRADTWFLYALVDSRDTDTFRYIGITNNPRSRLGLHMSQAQKEGWKKSRWIQSVVADRSEILMHILAEGLSQVAAMDMEVALISRLRADGLDLTNLTDGGDGVQGQVQSPETRSRKSLALRGRAKSPDAVARQADSLRGRRASIEERETLRASQLKRYEENPSIRTQISAALKTWYQDPSKREMVSMANKRRYSDPEQRQKTGEKTTAVKIAAPPSRNNSSGFKGVSFNKRNGKWSAYINVNGVRRNLGNHSSSLLAAEAYDAAAIKHYGADCFLNMKSG